MPQEKTIEVGIINVVLHPHSPDLYVKLFREARNNKISGIINKNKRARVGFIENYKDFSGEMLYGRLFFYTVLNPNEPWLDDESGEIASDDQLEQLREQLRSLYPEFRAMRFALDPSAHKLYFEVKNEERKSFSPSTVHKALISIFNNPKIQEDFGEVELTIVPTQDALEKILKIEDLRKFSIDLRPPNSDGWSDESEELEKWLEEMNVSRLEQNLTKSKGAQTITPDERTLKLARVAQQNGKVVGSGYTNGKKVTESTESYPKVEKYKLDNKTSAVEAFKGFITRTFRIK